VFVSRVTKGKKFAHSVPSSVSGCLWIYLHDALLDLKEDWSVLCPEMHRVPREIL